MLQLPIFPLPLVLLPGATLPLHIFEARYRQMVAHCIESDKRFGLVYHDPDESGPFRVEGQVGCIAEIRDFQPIPDGRSMIVVQGHERITLEDDVGTETMYYLAGVRTYEDLDANPPGIRERRDASIDRFQRVMSRISSSPSEVPPLDGTRDASFQLARWIRTAPQWHQRLLESRSEVERLDEIDLLLFDALEHLG
jgi:Lon protease-like protein